MAGRKRKKSGKVSAADFLSIPSGAGYPGIPVERIRPFRDYPFRITDDDRMHELVENIMMNGMLTPVIVRGTEEDGYETISGHRRLFAAKQIGLTEIPAVIREFSDDEAVMEMVDSGLQREDLLISEKAFAYRMRYEALRRSLGKQSDRHDYHLHDEFIARVRGTEIMLRMFASYMENDLIYSMYMCYVNDTKTSFTLRLNEVGEVIERERKGLEEELLMMQRLEGLTDAEMVAELEYELGHRLENGYVDGKLVLSDLDVIEYSAVRKKLYQIKKEEQITIVYGAGHRKSRLQKSIETLEGYISNLKEYIKHLHKCGERNSYSKTDPDATFMRMRVDAMLNGN